jgi:hypothetical protein
MFLNKTFKKGNFSLFVNKIGGVSIQYRRFCFEIGLFNDGDIPLFSFKLFNLCCGSLLQIISIEILKFNFSINIDVERKNRIHEL